MAGLAALLTLAGGCGGGGTVSTNPATAVLATTAAVQRLNQYRQAAELAPVVVDSVYSEGCQLHAEYLVTNQIRLHDVQLAAHTEDASLHGYSVAGVFAAENSIIFQGVSATTAIDQWLQTLYHRLGLFDPNLKKVGCGAAGDYLVLDDNRGRARGLTAVSTYTVFPPDGWTQVAPDYRREIPHPIPGDDSLGIPLSVEFYGSLGFDIANVLTEVVNARDGSNIPCYVQTPGHPFLAGWDYPQLIVLIPRDPLPAQCPVHVSIHASVDGQPWNTAWTFTTR